MLTFQSHAQIAPIETFKGKQHIYMDGHWHILAENGEFVEMEDSVITAKFESYIDSTAKANFETAYKLTFIRRSDAGYIDYSVNPDSVFKIARRMDTASVVAFVKLNFVFKLQVGEQKCYPNDYYYTNNYLEHLDVIKAPEMWYYMYCGPNTTENCQPIVAVIDNGLDISHPDLGKGADSYENINKIGFENDWSNPINPTTGNQTDDGFNSYVDDWKGWDFTGPGGALTGDNDVASSQHGTMVAGIIAAKTYNSIGISGIAGGWQNQPGAQIMPINVDAAGGYILGSVVDNAIDYARHNGAKVINMSFGGIDAADQLDIQNSLRLAHEAGLILVAASGNHQVPNDLHIVRFPANSKYVIAVGETFNNDVIAPISCFMGKRIDLVAPHANMSTADTWTYGTPADGTSFSAPLVSGTVANMLCVNPCLTNEWARDILRVTADKVTAVYNAPDEYPAGFNQEYGYGRLNAFEAVKMAKQLHYTTYQDLYMKDCPDDMGFTGVNYACTTVTDASPDIWIRNQQDGFDIDEHEEPNAPPNPVYVYVRVRNKSCVASTPNRTLNVYWSKAATWTSWPQNWDGTIPSLGDLIGTITLPSIPAGQVMTFELAWTIPSYINNFGYNPFCILARVEGVTNDDIIGNVSSVEVNNNVTIRNTGLFGIGNNILGNGPDDGHFYPLGGYIDIVNPIDVTTAFDFHFNTPIDNNGNFITDVAEMTVIFDDPSWSAFSASGSLSQDGVKIVKDNEIIIYKNDIIFKNVELDADSRFTTFVGTKFLIDSFTTDKTYHYLVAQTYKDSTTYLGGENLTIKRSSRIPFNADAGPNQNAFPGDSVTLTAAEINEDAIYEWYLGSVLKYTGRIYKFSAISNTTYLLKVTAVADGSIDYDSVNVNIKTGVINSIYPNPVTNTTTVTYNVANVGSASLMLVHPFYLLMSTYTLNTSNTSINIDMSSFGTGTYSFLLNCDGNIQDVETVIKQ